MIGEWLLLGLILGSASPSAADAPAPPSARTDSSATAAPDLSPRWIAPETGDPDWHIPYTGSTGASAAPDESPPPLADSQRLQDALYRYQAIQSAGGWLTVPPGADLQVGDRDPRVEFLRNRLRITGDYTSEMGADPWFFDSGMDEALRRFQFRHGISQTGIFDERTSAAANVSVEDRISQLAATLERWRWLPRDLGSRYAWVNTAAASLDIIESGHTVLTMRTIVGHPDRPTPSFRSEIRQVVFNPTWTVPRIIAVEDLLPHQQDDIGFLPRLRIRVLSGFGPTEHEMDATRIAWDQLNATHFPYRLRQDPGPWNSLGRVKFVMDNPFAIYLHDTPSPQLFGLTVRTLGSGCVRLEEPFTLANLLLQTDANWTPADTQAHLAGGSTEAVDLTRRLPIYVVYLTAWVTPEGVVHFRRDLYGWDARLIRALGPD